MKKTNMKQMTGLLMVTLLLGCGGASIPEKYGFGVKAQNPSSTEEDEIPPVPPALDLVSVKLVCKVSGKLESGEAVYARGDLPELGNSNTDFRSALPLELDLESNTWSALLENLPLSLEVNWRCILANSDRAKVLTEGKSNQFNTGDTAGQIEDQIGEVRVPLLIKGIRYFKEWMPW